MSKLRSPRAVKLEESIVVMYRRPSWSTDGKKRVWRCYVTLDFGGKRKRLTVSRSIARWLRGAELCP